MKIFLKNSNWSYLDHEVFTVSDMGWNGKKNGELLQLILTHKFDCLLTFDKNLAYQQNFNRYSVCVIVLSARSSRYIWLKPLMHKVRDLLNNSLRPGPIEIS